MEKLFEYLCKICLAAAVVLLMAIDSERVVPALVCFALTITGSFAFYQAAVFMHDNY